MKSLFTALTCVLHIALACGQTMHLDWVNQLTGGQPNAGILTTVNQSNWLYVVGSYDGSIDLDPSGFNLVQASENSSTSTDFFVAKYDLDGNYLDYNFTLYGTQELEVTGIEVDLFGNVYIAGTFTGLIDLDGTTLQGPTSATDGFTARFDTNGNLTWSRHLSSTEDVTVTGLMLTSDDDLVVTGYFESAVLFGGSSVSAQGRDGFIARYSGTNNNTLEWFGHLTDQGNANDIMLARLTDQDNIIVVGNFTSSTDFDLGPSTLNLDLNEGNVFVAEYSSQGNLVWAKNITLTDAESLEDIAFDTQGNMFMCGEHKDGDDLDPSPGTSSLPDLGAPVGNSGFSDGFFAKYDNSFTYIFGKTIGSTQGQGAGERALHIGVASCGTIFLHGYTTGNEAHLDPNNLNSVTFMNERKFVAAYDANGQYLAHDTIGFSINDCFIVSDTIYTTGSFSHQTDFDLGTPTNMLDPGNSRDLFYGDYWFDGCGLVTEIEEYVNDPELNVYPNPSNGVFTIQARGSNMPMCYEVVDMLGRVVASGRFSSNMKGVTLEDVVGGVFVLKVEQKNGDVGIKRFVVGK